MTENNAAQAVQESERNAAVEEYFGHRTWIKPTASNFRLFEAGFDRAYALLSKLRAEGVQAGEPEQFKAAFPNGVLTSARFHEIWERAGKTRNGNYTLLENLTWQVGQFGDLVAQAASAPVAGDAQPLGYVAEWVAKNGPVVGRSRITSRHQATRTAQQWQETHPQQGPMRVTAVYTTPQASEAVDLSAVSDIALEDEMRKRGAWVAPQADKDGGDCAKGAGDVELLALMERAAREAGGSQWVAEGFESLTAGAAFYGGLIMNADGETIVAQCVNEPNASHMMSSSPANVLWLIRQYRAALSPTPAVVKQSLTATQTGEKGESDA
jgi:hypothetical protein